jgi:phosphotransferase family enzyme
MTDWIGGEWLAEATNWIEAELKPLGIMAVGAITQPHIRPWSTVLKVPTNEGDVYFKATAPLLGHEAALTLALFQWKPECMPAVLAVDKTRGWLLMRDCGVTVRSLSQGIGDLYHWREILPLYTRLQIEMVGRTTDLLALGTPDRRPEQLPRLFRQLIADTALLRIGQRDGLTSDEYRQVQALAPQVSALCEELATGGIPASLHHDDFHDANIFVRDGRYIFTDWGEAFVAHPFFSMVVMLRSIAHTFQLDAADPALALLQKLYLEPWTRFAPPDRLRKIFPLAQRAGKVCRTITWYQVVLASNEPEQSQHVESVIGWLREVLAEFAA